MKQERTGSRERSVRQVADRQQSHKSKSRHRRDSSGKAVRSGPAGLLARELAVDLVMAVLTQNRALDEAISTGLASPRFVALEPRDRALARQIAATTLRFARPLRALIDQRLNRPMSARYARASAILLTAAAQLCRMATPPHAAISLAVEQTRLGRGAHHLDKLVNAVLRSLARDGVTLTDEPTVIQQAYPEWMLRRWVRNYGERTAHAIAAASLHEAALDLTVKSEPQRWAERLGGVALATGGVRLVAGGRIEELEGFAEGAWWVQDTAAALPARLVRECGEVADLCAAPGGKTALLAARGARVTAVDLSAERLARLSSNLDRLSLTAELIEADAALWRPSRQFDAVLLDAPCTATGTIRRHPDIIHLKRESDVAKLSALQSRLLANASELVKPGGELVYCTCSLEPEEGEEQVRAFLDSHPEFEISPIDPGRYGVEAAWVTSDGALRTLPCYSPALAPGSPEPADDVQPPSGMDGFFIARLRRTS